VGAQQNPAPVFLRGCGLGRRRQLALARLSFLRANVSIPADSEKPKKPLHRIEKIISGGQTGADRAALDFARAHGIPHGGWCPRGRKAADGPLAECYQLPETPGAEYAQRTEWNVRDADATVIFSVAPTLAGGSQQTAEFALRWGKPCLHLSRERDGAAAAEMLSGFLATHRVKTLNVAGPRQSEEPDVAGFCRQTLERVLLGTASTGRVPASGPGASGS